jgi:hypothetical protein
MPVEPDASFENLGFSAWVFFSIRHAHTGLREAS